ncbi:MAG: DUF1549 domain-containing protein [Isosphaeraceae bacterium]
MKILPSGLCTDAEFIRRVSLDLTGLPPSADEVRSFLADARDSKSKREALVDRLIGSPDYVDYWTNKWADLLQVNRKFLDVEGAAAARLDQGQLAANTPYDAFVKSIVTATGSTRPIRGVYFKVLRGRPRSWRTRRSSSSPCGSVATVRPPVRTLDPGPVLPDRRVLRARWG